MSIKEARDLTIREIKFKEEKGRLKFINLPDPPELLMSGRIGNLQRK